MTDAYPLQWPFGKPRNNYPQRSRFDVAFSKARDELMREIAFLGGASPVLSTNIPCGVTGCPTPGKKSRRIEVSRCISL
jgi:hypothetical protein